MDSGVTHLHIRNEMRKYFKWMVGIMITVVLGLAGSITKVALDQQREMGDIKVSLAVVTDNLDDTIKRQAFQDVALEKRREQTAEMLVIMTQNQMEMVDRLHRHEMSAKSGHN